MKHYANIIPILVGLILVCTGCFNSLQNIIEDTKEATVTIYTFDEYGSPSGEGSGFFIDDKGTCFSATLTENQPLAK